MLSRTICRRALALALLTFVACDIQSRTSLSGNEAARLDVSPKLLTLQQNQAADFTAIAFTSTGDTADLAVSWSATSGTIIDTSTNSGRHNGRYRAGADTGKVKVVAKGRSGGPADTSVVTVTLAPVTSILVSPAAASVAVGQTVQLTATPQDVGGNPLSGRVVTWASTNLGVATVNGSGLVTGVAAGVATVTVACEGQSNAVAITVTVVPVASVSVSPASANVIVGQTAQLTATPKDANGNPLSGRTVTWATSNAAVASVSGNGLVTGGAAGTATITASSEGQNGTAAITVTLVPVASVSVNPASATVLLGQTVQMTATPKDANGSPLAGRAVTWASSAPAAATVSASGLVTAVGAGSATITATSEGKNGTSAITVTVVPVATVTVSPASKSLNAGATVQLTATTKDSAGNVLTGRLVTWSSSAPAVATVSASGLVTAVAVGSATITATSEGKSGTAAITVAVIPVAAVEVTPASASIAVASTVQLSAVAKDAAGGILSGRPMTWSSSSVQISTVAAGLVTGVAAGTAYIVASSEGMSDTATITVTFVPVASVTVSPDATSVAVDGNFQFTAILKDAAGNVLNGRAVTWSSGNPAVATVSATGLARGVATGTAAITALSEGITGSASLTVITPPPVGQCGAWPAGITAWIQPLAPSTGQAFYASPTGSDANPGTLAAPWRSLTKANSLQPGQILYLRAGTYGARGTNLNLTATGTASAPITVSGYPGDGRPLIQGQIYVNGSYFRLTNVVIDGPTGNVGGPGPNGEGNIIILWGRELELSNSEVRFGQWHAGVGVDGGLNYRILNNYIHDNGGYLGDYSTSDPSWNNDHGVYASPSSYGLIANNVIEHNDSKGLMGRHDANHILVVNNTVVGNGRYGIDINESTHDWTLANNILLNNGTIKGGGGIGTPGTGGTSYIEINNLFWNNGSNGTTTWDNNALVINNRVAAPMLANPAVATDHQNPNPNTDNQLRAGSPAIGFADPNYTLPFDITGKCRGAAPDAGAYQR